MEYDWGELCASLSESDLPIRVAFLDKSGSMGCDNTSFSALTLAAYHTCNPTRGCCFSFLMAGPGETELRFHRPSEIPVESTISLGSSTWFNEPVVRVLTALAETMEGLPIRRWSEHSGEPALQVVCVTDGLDNCSHETVHRLPGMLDAIR